MIDVALVPTGDLLDVVVDGGDLRPESGMTTAVLISLLSDGLAEADDELPDAGADRRGWWAGNVLARDRGDFFGSRLWLLERSKLSNEVLVRAEELVREALAWLVSAGIAERVDVTASRLDNFTLLITVSIVRGEATERPDLWTSQLSATLAVGPTRFQLVATP